MQGSSGAGFILAQVRQVQTGDRLVLGHLGLGLGAFGNDRGRFVQRNGRFGLGLSGIGPLDVVQHGLAGADVGGELLEARCLPGLPLQALDLAFQLRRDVIETLEIGFGGAEPQFGLVAARMQAGDAGGLFQQLPARLGLA